MNDLDLRSAMIFACLLVGLMSVVLFFIRGSYPKSIHGIGTWASGLATLFVSYAVFSGRGNIPEALVIVCGNLLVMASLLILYFGSQRFFGLKTSIRLWGGIGLAALLVMTWFSLVEPNFRLRVAGVMIFAAAALFAHLRLIFLHGNGKFSSRFVIFVLALEAAITTSRLFSLLLAPSNEAAIETQQIQDLYVMSFITSYLLQGIGMMLMASDRLHDELEHLARHDALTGCLGRRAWLDICNQEMDRSIRSGRQMAVLMMDIDHFKKINDNYGHQIGDRVIVDFVKNATGALRRADSLGRYGGEEFVALLPETGSAQALIVAERLRSAVELASGNPSCTVSVGVATSDVNLSVDGLLARADRAMYQAKNGGRNRVELHAAN